MNKNEIVTIVAATGAEYVGKYKSESPEYFLIGDPHIVSPDGNNLGFMPTVAMTGTPEISEVKFQKTGVILVVPTADAVAKEYLKSCSGIIV